MASLLLVGYTQPILDELNGAFMGLDFSHCSAMWSYSAFNGFRSRLMEEAHYSWDDVLSRKGADPLHVLLNHSDCEGYIEVADCIPLADRLAEVTASWWADDKDRYETVLLIKGLRAASVRGEVLKFL